MGSVLMKLGCSLHYKFNQLFIRLHIAGTKLIILLITAMGENRVNVVPYYASFDGRVGKTQYHYFKSTIIPL